MIGSDTVPATVGGAFTATGRFVNHNYNASTAYGFDSANYGLYVDVANGTKIMHYIHQMLLLELLLYMEIL